MSVREPAPAESAAAIAAGDWTRRFTAIGPRLREAVDLYRTLGYELRLDPADAGGAGLSDEACAQCLVMALARTIYTRPPAGRDQQRST
jgi:hypothetical protein